MEEDYIDEDEDIEALISAAEKYLINAGCVLNIGDEVAKLATKMIVVVWHENRESVGTKDQFSFVLKSLILQLQFATVVIP